MEVTLLGFRLILAGIFSVAGAAKLADIAGSRKAFADFGIPASIAGPLAIGLPVAEIAIAASLLFVQSSWYGSIGATALLAGFIGGMAYQMAKGKAPDCHCFGQLHSEPVSPKSLIRNVVILAPAIVLSLAGRSGQGLSIANLNIETVQLFAVFGCVGLLVAGGFYLRKISGKQDQIMRRIELLELLSSDGNVIERKDAGDPRDGLPIGAYLPEFNLPDLNGKLVTNDDIFAGGKPAIFLFVSPTCTPCQAMAPMFDGWAAELDGRVNFVFVSSGTAESNIKKFGGSGKNTVLLQNEREFADLVYAKWTPSALFVDADGKVASHVGAGDAAIIELMDKVKASDLTQEFTYFKLSTGNGIIARTNVGDEIPEFSIDAIDGRTVTSDDLKGKTTLLTFWSPTCPFCAQMMEEIKAWDVAKGADAPELIVFSNGDIESHRQLGMRSPIVLDPEHELAGTLGMYGTPSAILINEEGRFASETAIGSSNIWALVGRNGKKSGDQ